MTRLRTLIIAATLLGAGSVYASLHPKPFMAHFECCSMPDCQPGDPPPCPQSPDLKAAK